MLLLGDQMNPSSTQTIEESSDIQGDERPGYARPSTLLVSKTPDIFRAFDWLPAQHFRSQYLSVSFVVQVWMFLLLLIAMPSAANATASRQNTSDQAAPLSVSHANHMHTAESSIDEVSVVELLYFTATEENGDTLIAWKTTSETNNQGFNLYRSTTPEGPWTKINFSLIPARGSASAETRYSLTDIGNSGWYLLEDLDSNGTFTQHPPTTSEGSTAVPPPPPSPSPTAPPTPVPATPAVPETPGGEPSTPDEPLGQTAYNVYIPLAAE